MKVLIFDGEDEVLVDPAQLDSEAVLRVFEETAVYRDVCKEYLAKDIRLMKKYVDITDGYEALFQRIKLEHGLDSAAMRAAEISAALLLDKII